MATLNLLYKHEFAISDRINIVVPTVGEIINDEDNYYNIVTLLTAMPIDFMLQLTDAGLDFTNMTAYDLFIIMFPALKSLDTHLVFGDLDLSKFDLQLSKQTGKPVLYDEENDITINRAIHEQIAVVLRNVHHLEKNRRKPANKEAKEYMLERARIKADRNKKRKKESELEQLIVALVNTEQFKYNYETVKDISIYQFNQSVRQIIHKVDYDNRMIGVYAGTISTKKLSNDDLNWLKHK